MANTNFLYFLSTIAQVLGSVLAFLGVFIVLRLEKFNQEIAEYARQVRDQAGTFFHLGNLEMFSTESMIEHVRKHIRENQTDSYKRACEEVSALISEYDKSILRKSNVIREFIAPLLLTAFIIIISVGDILLVPSNNDQPSEKFWLLFGLSSGGFILSMASSVYFVYRSLYHKFGPILSLTNEKHKK